MCIAIVSAFLATLRVASAVAATCPTPEAVVDAIWAASCACLYAMVSPTGDTERERRGLTLSSVGEQMRRLSNVVFGTNVYVDVPPY